MLAEINCACDTGFINSTVVDDKSIQYVLNNNINSEADIFSELPVSVFCGDDEMSLTMNLFREKFYNYIIDSKEILVMPKLKYSEEGTERVIRMVFSWNNGNAIVYFSFDKQEIQNYAGYSKSDNGNNEIFSITKNINEANRLDIINEVVNFIYSIN